MVGGVVSMEDINMSNSESEIGAFMAGFVIGGLVGAATALLMAPQSGEETRAQIALKSHEVREASAQQYEAARVRVADTTGQVQEQARIVLDEGKSKMAARSKSVKETAEAQAVEDASTDDATGEDAV